MTHPKMSIYPLEFRNKMAEECHELLAKNETTVKEFAAARNINCKCLYNWLRNRYGLIREQGKSSTSSFVKIERAPVTVSIDYYGASIQTTDVNLVQVLAAIKKAATI